MHGADGVEAGLGIGHFTLLSLTKDDKLNSLSIRKWAGFFGEIVYNVFLRQKTMKIVARLIF